MPRDISKWGLVTSPSDREKDSKYARSLNRFVIIISLIATILLFFV